jgi:hypothetical protein
MFHLNNFHGLNCLEETSEVQVIEVQGVFMWWL